MGIVCAFLRIEYAVYEVHRPATVVGLALDPPAAGLACGLLANPDFRRGHDYPSPVWLGMAAVTAAAASYLWSTLPWPFAVRRFTRDLTPAPDAAQVPT